MGEIDAESRPRALAHAIDTSRTARDYGNALEQSKAAVDEFPDNLALASLRATVLAETGNTKEAAKVLKGLLKGNSEDREIYLALAQVHEKGKQYDKAIEAVEKAHSLSKTRGEQLGVLFAYGSVLERAKRFDDAEAKFTELLKLDPENASALNYFGYMLADLNKRLNDAHDMIQKALDLEPNNGAYLDSLGWVYYRQEKFDLAERFLLRSLEQFNRDPVVHSHLGDVYYKQGKVDQAQKHWKRSLEEWQRNAKSDQDQAEIMEVRKKLDSLALQLSSEAAGSKEIKE
jgi:predicted Zn-dependent protease